MYSKLVNNSVNGIYRAVNSISALSGSVRRQVIDIIVVVILAVIIIE